MSTSSPPSGGLRERNKAKRRNAILDAALDLLDGPEGSPIAAERIAELAEVSVATVYNLVGRREQLLLALVDRLIAGLVQSADDESAATTTDPVQRLRGLTERSVDLLTTRPVAYRRVVLQLTAAANTELHTTLSPGTLAAEAFRHAQQTGSVRADLHPEALAAQWYVSYNGALLRWAAGALSDPGFKAAALHGLAVVLAASATPKARAAALADLRRLGDELVRS